MNYEQKKRNLYEITEREFLKLEADEIKRLSDIVSHSSSDTELGFVIAAIDLSRLCSSIASIHINTVISIAKQEAVRKELKRGLSLELATARVEETIRDADQIQIYIQMSKILKDHNERMAKEMGEIYKYALGLGEKKNKYNAPITSTIYFARGAEMKKGMDAYLERWKANGGVDDN
jgi:hypothetical protein